MRQVNFVFGETLEISTTVRDNGSIHSQEIVSSGPDALIGFKIDGKAALTPELLRRLADAIEGPQNESSCCSHRGPAESFTEPQQPKQEEIPF